MRQLQKANTIISDAQKEAEKIVKEAYSQGFEKGREEGYNAGKEEVNRLIGVMHKVVGELIKRERVYLKRLSNSWLTLFYL